MSFKNRLDNLFNKDIEDKIVSIQKWIALALFLILIGLILFNAFGDRDKAQMINNSYLPIVSGWIGIILGFYFSREIAGIIGQKLKNTKKDYKQTVDKVEREFEEFKERTTATLINILKNKK